MSYKCGYINIKGNWHRARGSESALVNTGPMADSTLGNFNGEYALWGLTDRKIMTKTKSTEDYMADNE